MRDAAKPWRRLKVAILPMARPTTLCMKPEEPPPGSLSLRVLSGGGLRGQERWIAPGYFRLVKIGVDASVGAGERLRARIDALYGSENGLSERS